MNNNVIYGPGVFKVTDNLSFAHEQLSMSVYLRFTSVRYLGFIVKTNEFLEKLNGGILFFYIV